jgi:hypothetical protein
MEFSPQSANSQRDLAAGLVMSSPIVAEHMRVGDSRYTPAELADYIIKDGNPLGQDAAFALSLDMGVNFDIQLLYTTDCYIRTDHASAVPLKRAIFTYSGSHYNVLQWCRDGVYSTIFDPNDKDLMDKVNIVLANQRSLQFNSRAAVELRRYNARVASERAARNGLSATAKATMPGSTTIKPTIATTAGLKSAVTSQVSMQLNGCTGKSSKLKAKFSAAGIPTIGIISIQKPLGARGKAPRKITFCDAAAALEFSKALSARVFDNSVTITGATPPVAKNVSDTDKRIDALTAMVKDLAQYFGTWF